MQIYRRFAAGVAASALLLPAFVFAFPFGGQTYQVLPCYNKAIIAYVGAPRGGTFIWTPSTRTYQFGPPAFAGQWLLGLASAPYYCVVSIMPIDVRAGIAIDMMGSSGGGSYTNLLNTKYPGAALPSLPPSQGGQQSTSTTAH